MRRAIPVETVPRISGYRGGNVPKDFIITLSNRGEYCVEVGDSEPLLVSLERNGVSLPYGCRYGGCISCAAKLLKGKVDQSQGLALNGRQLAAGYVLLCVARPLENCVFEVGVESHDQLFRNPFQSPLKHGELKPSIRGVEVERMENSK